MRIYDLRKGSVEQHLGEPVVTLVSGTVAYLRIMAWLNTVLFSIETPLFLAEERHLEFCSSCVVDT